MLCDDLARNLTQSPSGVLQFQLAARTIFKVFIVMRCIAPCVAMFFHSSRYNNKKKNAPRCSLHSRDAHTYHFLCDTQVLFSLAPNTSSLFVMDNETPCSHGGDVNIFLLAFFFSSFLSSSIWYHYFVLFNSMSFACFEFEYVMLYDEKHSWK